MNTVLIAEDEPSQRRALAAIASRAGFSVLEAETGQQALDILQGPNGGQICALMADLQMPKMSGLELVKAIRPQRPRLPIIVLTAHTTLNNAIESMRAGANDFIAKPASPERIRAALATATNENIADGELRPLSEKLGAQLTFEQLVGQSAQFLRAVSLARRAANSSAPVLIEGESGVGKELIAQSIHSASPRANGPFVVVNCGALPAQLAESLLFGHEKGAFTGAVDRHMGKFLDANGGTLFLDEIGELSLDLQVKLLRVLQEGEVEPVGSRSTVKVDVRIVSATNRELAVESAQGRFREDLYYRLNVVQLTIPPLRERREDIPALINHFIARTAALENIHVRGVSDEAMTLLTAFDWPGNVRQLQNAIFRAVVLCDSDRLSMRDFPQILAQAQRAERTTPALPSAVAADAAASTDRIQLTDARGHVRALQELEADAIRFAVSRYRGRMSEVARRLGIGRSTLYRKLREYGLEERMAAEG